MLAPDLVATLLWVGIGEHTGKMRALVANEPRSYRDVLVDGLRRLRPHVEVNAADPDVLYAEVERFDPHLVVCSRNHVPNPDESLAWVCWVKLYPDGANLAEITTAGGRAMVAGIRFGDLLSVVDGAEFLRCSRDHGGVAGSDRCEG